jgi:hypothetical protein
MIFFFLLSCFLMYFYGQAYKNTLQAELSSSQDASVAVRSYLTGISIGGFAIPSNQFFEAPLPSNKSFDMKCSSGFYTNDTTYSYYGVIDRSV